MEGQNGQEKQPFLNPERKATLSAIWQETKRFARDTCVVIVGNAIFFGGVGLLARRAQKKEEAVDNVVQMKAA